MRKAKMNAKPKKVVRHTRKERLALRRHKRKHGPSALRRAARRAVFAAEAAALSVQA